MPNSTFIQEEKLSNSQRLLSLNLRLFKALPLFLKLLPLTIVMILLGSAAPSVFRWYAGKYTTEESGFFTLTGIFCLAGFAAFFRIIAWVSFEATGMWASQGIYSKMIRSLSQTRTTFFDENPSGRIINRLIRDYDELRSSAIIFVGDVINATIEILGVATVASFASLWAGVAIVPLLGLFILVQTQRSQMIEHCRALSSVATSRVLNRNNDLIEGREIYILFGKGQHLLTRMKESLTTYLQASILTVEVDTWASFWIRIFAESFSFVVLLFTIAALSRHDIDAPVAGVIISALFGITGLIGWLDFASSMVSQSAPNLRRVFEYVDLPSEQSQEMDLPRPNVASLTQMPEGNLRFENYTMSYRKDSPLILVDLNLVVSKGSKTALIGRTGSGKSSIMQALMRMVYVHQGDIRIGDSSIFDYEAGEVRKLFGVVPQFPYLFEGSLRSNLDRTGTLSDEKLLRALSEVGLDFELGSRIQEGGLNLSVGERQLLCMARVIASSRPFILMDEPTSGLDPITDARIHWVLSHALKDKTVLTIAHRMESLKDYDTVVEMSAGRAVKN